jgi:hypothetical protein
MQLQMVASGTYSVSGGASQSEATTLQVEGLLIPCEMLGKWFEQTSVHPVRCRAIAGD